MVVAYAFWRYDSFPYCLHGKVKATDKNGYVHVEGYDSLRFRPFLVLLGAEGKRMSLKLDALRDEYRHANDVLDYEYDEKLRAIMPDNPTFKDNPLGEERRKRMKATAFTTTLSVQEVAASVKKGG